MDILYLSPADWDGPRGRFQHIALRLARTNRVIYTDGLGIRRIGTGDWRRSLSKVLGSLRPAAERPAIDGELYRLVPLAVPGQSSTLQCFNRALLHHFLSFHLKQRGFHDLLVWISYPHPDLVAILDQFRPRAVIYDCVDEWSHFESGYSNIADVEEQLVRRADLVFSTMPSLQKRMSSWNPRSFLVPNGVDVEFFAGSKYVEPDDMASIPHPRIGFVGNIAEWVDMEIIEGIARSRKDWQLVLVGDYLAKSPRPEGDNIHWLGFRPYDDVPDYLRSFDVCIIPFIDNELTRGADPLKLYEYLAAGKPVISTPIPRSVEFSDVIEIASGTDEFVSAIDAVLSDDNDSSERRIAAASPHSWSSRYGNIVDMTKKHLAMDLQ